MLQYRSDLRGDNRVVIESMERSVGWREPCRGLENPLRTRVNLFEKGLCSVCRERKLSGFIFTIQKLSCKLPKTFGTFSPSLFSLKV